MTKARRLVILGVLAVLVVWVILVIFVRVASGEEVIVVEKNSGFFSESGRLVAEVVLDKRLVDFVESLGYKMPGKEALANFSTRDHGDLMLVIAIVESSLKVNAKNGNNYGLMQVADVHLLKEGGKKTIGSVCNVETAEDLFDVGKNLCSGGHLLTTFIVEEKGDVEKALLKYNSSTSKVLYAKKVLELYVDLVSFKGDLPRYDFDLGGN
jgi:hypothetical protein